MGTSRARTTGELADLQIQVDVPTQTNILLTSAGGQVEIEGVDGFVSGTTESGALVLLRLSGAIKLETKRGDVTLQQSYVRGTVHTNDGHVLMEDVSGDVQGTTSKGRVIGATRRAGSYRAVARRTCTFARNRRLG